MKALKKTLILMLAACMLLTMLPIAHAGDVFSCEVRDDGVWITGGQVSGDLVIPDEIAGRPVVGIARDAFSDRGAYITSVHLPDTLRYVEGNAFCACTRFADPITIPSSVEWIDPTAFIFTRIIGKAHSAVDRYRLASASSYCTIQGDTVGYETIYDNNNTYWIHGDEAELVHIGSVQDDFTLILPETVEDYPLTSIGPFCGVRGRNAYPIHLVVPGTVRTIRDYAFWNSSISSVYLCEGVQTLGAYCLDLDDDNYRFAAVTLPRSVEQVDPHAFHHDLHSTRDLTTFYVYRDSPAARVAEAQRCKVTYRDGSDGMIYGVWGGLSFRVDDGNAEICERFSTPFSFAPDRIEDWPVTKLDLDGSKTDPGTYYIPPDVTEITHDSQLDYPVFVNELLHVVYPGSYGESYCRARHRNYMSIYTYWGVPFEDTPENRWYYDAVCHCYHTGLMSGVSDTRFAPNNVASRAMLVTVLWRMAGCPEAAAPSGFLDVAKGTWYADSVAWAQENGIVNGVSETSFAPNRPVTREQLATILCRYMGGEADEKGLSSVREFPDAGRISPWALDAFAWAKTEGILKGQLTGNQVYLNPLGQTTRAELATVLMRCSLK